MKKVLQINSVYSKGSTGKIVDLIDNIAREQGWDSYIAYGRGVKIASKNVFYFGNKLNSFIHLCKTRISDDHGLGSKRQTRKLVNYIENLKPDVVHLHNIHGYYLNYEILLKYLIASKIQIVWTMHDCWLYTGHCAYYTTVNCVKWINGCYSCEKLSDYPKSFWLDKSQRNYLLKKNLFEQLKNPIFIPVSKWLQHEISQSFLKKYSNKVIYNGVDSDLFNRVTHFNDDLNFPKGMQIILGVAHPWNTRKGFGYFNELANILPEDVVIVLVGVEDSQFAELNPLIICRKKLSSTLELARYYSRADIFLNMSIEDNFPTTIIESLACGTPVITFDTGGCKEALDNETGIVLPIGNLEMVRNSINHILANKNSYNNEKCRNRAISKFNYSQNYMEYINIYNQLYENRK